MLRIRYNEIQVLEFIYFFFCDIKFLSISATRYFIDRKDIRKIRMMINLHDKSIELETFIDKKRT